MSIQRQTYRNVEILVADDGSTDETVSLVRRQAERDSRIRMWELQHRGPGATANFLTAQARGEFLARMDADDVALPERLQVQLEFLREHDLDACGSWAHRFGSKRGGYWSPQDQPGICHEHFFRLALLHPTMLIKAEVARAIPYREDVRLEDYVFFVELLTRYRVRNVPRLLLRWRAHPRQTTTIHTSECQRDIATYRELLFDRLYPGAQPEDRAALQVLWNEGPCAGLAELQLQGKWLAAWSGGQELHQRLQFRGRWLQSCLRSTRLGWRCYRAYQRCNALFDVPPHRYEPLLALLCGFRLSPDSRAFRVLGRVWRFLRKRVRWPEGGKLAKLWRLPMTTDAAVHVGDPRMDGQSSFGPTVGGTEPNR